MCSTFVQFQLTNLFIRIATSILHSSQRTKGKRRSVFDFRSIPTHQSLHPHSDFNSPLELLTVPQAAMRINGYKSKVKVGGNYNRVRGNQIDHYATYNVSGGKWSCFHRRARITRLFSQDMISFLIVAFFLGLNARFQNDCSGEFPILFTVAHRYLGWHAIEATTSNAVAYIILGVLLGFILSRILYK